MGGNGSRSPSSVIRVVLGRAASMLDVYVVFFFSSRRRHTRCSRDWSSDVCSSDLIDGILYDQEAPPRRLQAAVTSRIKIMAEMNIAERRLPQDGRIRVNLHGARVDIRVSTIPTVHGAGIGMRLLPRSSVVLSLQKLGFPART